MLRFGESRRPDSGLAFRDFAKENRYDALAISCWPRFHTLVISGFWRSPGRPDSGLAFRDFAKENRYDALAISCWPRFHTPCYFSFWAIARKC